MLVDGRGVDGAVRARSLAGRDLPAVQRLLAAQPVSSCAIAARVEAAETDQRELGGELWGLGDPLRAVCFAGANLVPAGTVDVADVAAHAFADRALRQGRRCSSIVGPAADVRALWTLLEPRWGPARLIRESQPLLAIDHPPLVRSDPEVRRATLLDLDILMPACVRMFTDEIGVSPLGTDGGSMYRERVRELIISGRSFVRVDGGEVIFKADLGAVSRAACQLQGVWVAPGRRGRGVGAAATAAVTDISLREVAPVVSLYVNDFNRAARAAYSRVGFRQVGEFASVMF